MDEKLFMKQRHSYSRLFFHIAFSTRGREHLIESPAAGEIILGFMKTKADDLDTYIEEFGCWHDHVHILVRTGPSLAPATFYGQVKGYSSRAWNLKNKNMPFRWQDGVYIATVDPDQTEALRSDIRAQWTHHEQRTEIANWEPTDH